MYKALSVGMAILMLASMGCAPDTTQKSPVMSLTAPVEKESWQTPYGDGAVLTSAHYKIYATARRGEIQTVLPRFMEAAHDYYRSVTGLADPVDNQPMCIYMMGTRNEWAELTAMAVKENQEVYMSIEAGGYCYKGVCVFWDVGGISTYAVASHEGMHQFLGARLQDHLPMWLEEGLCASMEGFELQRTTVVFTPGRNPIRMDNLRSILNSQVWIDLSQLLSMDAGDALTTRVEGAVSYYAQLWSLVQFIQSNPQYAQGMKRLISDAQKGELNVGIKLTPEQVEQAQSGAREYNRVLSEPIFRKYITNDLAGFEKEYHRYAKRLAGLDR